MLSLNGWQKAPKPYREVTNKREVSFPDCILPHFPKGHCDAGMSEEQIAAMKEYDWAWFCSQRVFQNHTQPIPCEQYDEVCGQSQLFRKFASLSYQWDVDKIDQTRYGWLASVENEQLLLRLKKLSKKDLELLTLLFVDGYRQIDVARLWHCSRSAVAQRFKKIKKFLNNT